MIIDSNKTDFQNAITCIKTVRNNLFHGGKYGEGNEFNCDDRARKQLQHGIGVIDYIIKELNLLKDFYE